MKRFFLFCVFTALVPFIINGQTKITGKVEDEKGSPMPGANVYIKGTYDGTTSKPDGTYSFKTHENGEVTLIASYVGYKKYESKIVLKKGEMSINIVLEEEITQMNAVVVSAGSFEASDEKKGVILKPLDVLTTGSTADLYTSLNTLPGAQKVGETEGLFVRGGAASEAKTIIDEMIVQKPYSSSVPDLPGRGRFSPMMFKGTVFSTGGYSAQYGQALSSALILKTQDMPAQTITSISLMALGLGAAHTQLWENTAFSVEGAYYNLNPYNNVFKQRVEWDRSPVGVSFSGNFRQKLTKNGLFKAFASYSKSEFSINLPDLDNPSGKTFYGDKPEDFYSNLSYKDIIGDWNLFGGFSYSLDMDRINYAGNSILQDQRLVQSKFTANKKILNNTYITFGAEAQNTLYDDTYNTQNIKLTEMYSAAFIESDIYFTNDLAAKIGLRTEYSKILDKFNLAPRVSFAYKIGKYDQLNFAYGRFYETPQKDYLIYYNRFNYENADHYIANYQYLSDDQTFRIEFYYKQYNNLVKGTVYTYPYFSLPVVPFSNDGSGYAKGIDVFWRDNHSLRYCDYWVSYSYLDTKREFSNYPVQAFPTFAAPHTFSVVFKRWFESLSTFVAFTYIHNSGRPYFNPNNPEFLGDRTPAYNNLSVNISHIARLFNSYSVIFFSVDNLLGFANVYGYRYSANGKISSPVLPPTLRSLFLGIFISIGEENQYQ